MRVKKNGGGIDGYKSLVPLYSPRGSNQKRYVEYLDDPKVSILLGVGPAGTGKTLFACSAAVQEMKRGAIQKIILTRPVVSVEEDIGFLPGSLIAKMDPWTRPIFDILGEFYTQKDVDSMLHSGAIEISPLAYMRGRTFKRAFVIADEMQNSSPSQMLMLTTRLGEGSKMVITGDLKQSDRMTNNGLLDILNKLRDYRGDCSSIKVVEMGVEDVERSAVVSKILDIYKDPEPVPEPVVVSVSSIIKFNDIKENDSALIPLRGNQGHQNQQS
jgi:phosphate starvation-inducible PhoH-like protein